MDEKKNVINSPEPNDPHQSNVYFIDKGRSSVEDGAPKPNESINNFPTDVAEWSLAEVITHCRHKEIEGQLTVRSSSNLLADDNISYRVSDGGTEISFTPHDVISTLNSIQNSLKRNEEGNFNYESLNEESIMEIIPGIGVKISTDIHGNKSIQINFGKYEEVIHDLHILGLRSILDNETLPNNYFELKDLSEIVHRLGRIKVHHVANRDDLIDLTKSSKDMNKISVFHGTSFESAMKIIRLGLFGIGNRGERQHPTLSLDSTNEVYETARSRSIGGRPGIVIEFLCDEDELEMQGGIVEKIGIPKGVYRGSRERLVINKLPKHILGSEDLRHFPPDKIKAIYVVPNTD